MDPSVPHCAEKSTATTSSGPVDPPSLARCLQPEQAFHWCVTCMVIERGSARIEAACMPRFMKPEALAVEVMAKLMAECAEESTK